MMKKLLSLWERQPEFGRPLGCVATTFTFEADFFEHECLSRFVGMESDPAESPRAYVVEREERFSDLLACVLVDRSHVAAQRSLRWNLLPCSVPHGGILHAKVSLLAWERTIRAIVASANLTSPGYRSNLESAAWLDFTPEGDTPKTVLTEVLDFLESVRSLAPGASSTAIGGPQEALRTFLRTVRRRTGDWADGSWPRGGPSVAFLPLRIGGRGLFQQIASEVWKGTGPSDATVVSPFFDDGTQAAEVASALVDSVMATNGERSIRVVAPGRELPDKQIEIDVPRCLLEPPTRRTTMTFAYVPERQPTGDSEELRSLHAKHVWLQREDRAVHVLGSSNFTRAGTGASGRVVNVEANVAFVIPSASAAFGRHCRDAMPRWVAVDPARQPVSFRGELPDSTAEAEGSVPLPSAFGLALFNPAEPQGTVLLQIASDAPQDFEVQAEGGEIVLDAATWRAQGSPASIERPWPHRRPPSYLDVDWTGGGGDRLHGVWVVNVSDASKLPPPEELRALTLDELIAILTSARPLHDAVLAVFRRREEKGESRTDFTLDPHGRVDTTNFLLRRMKRISGALESLSERLVRPASSVDALRWRLHGPVGPEALARRLAQEEHEAAAFMICEVALTVRDADWRPLEKLLGEETVRSEVRSVFDGLRELAAKHPAPSNLQSYVSERFAEANA